MHLSDWETVSTASMKLHLLITIASVVGVSAFSATARHGSIASRAAELSAKEWEQRCVLAAAYRIAYLHDWHENVFNHITLKVEGSDSEADGPHFLLNDFGMGFDEVTASSLLKVNLEGEEVSGRGKIFKPGFVIHSAIHEGRHDVSAVWHCHALDSTAVCQTKTGLLPISQEATYTLNKVRSPTCSRYPKKKEYRRISTCWH